MGVNPAIGAIRTWWDKRGGLVHCSPPLFDDPLSIFGLLEDLYSGNDNNQANDGKDK